MTRRGSRLLSCGSMSRMEGELKGRFTCKFSNSLMPSQTLMISSGIRIESAEWVNILEEPMPGDEATCAFEDDDGKIEIKLNMRHFEIKTLKLMLA